MCWEGQNTCNFLTFVHTTAIAYHQNHEALIDFLPICNSSCVHKRQKITSMIHWICSAAIRGESSMPELIWSWRAGKGRKGQDRAG